MGHAGYSGEVVGEPLLGSILVVEDDVDHAMLLEECLADSGYRVILARDGLEAIKQLKVQHFDLVLSDLNMPRVDGLDLLETIRDEGLHANVLMLSGSSSVTKAVAAMKLGAVNYLEKPFTLEALKAEVRAAIRASRKNSSDDPAHAAHQPADTAMMRPPPPGTVGPDESKIARYRVEELIGSGGMGTVYRCFDPSLDRSLAVKVLTLSNLAPRARQDLLDRFSLEARAAGRLRHPRIVTVHDFGEDPDRQLAFLAMELVDGQSLFNLLKNIGKLAWPFVVAVAHQIADALEYAHREGVVHRDVKPANILISDDDQVTLVDFGIAKLRESSVTQPGMILGTPGYLSPEMLRGAPIDHRSDQFSLGTVLFESLSGRRLFPSESFEALAAEVLSGEPPTFEKLGIAAPRALEQIVLRLHQRDPERSLRARSRPDRRSRQAWGARRGSTFGPPLGDPEVPILH